MIRLTAPGGLASLFIKIAVLGLGLMILAVSVARAGLEIMAREDADKIVRNETINFTAVFADGETSPGNYQLPESGMTVDNVFYGFKKLRDVMWLWFSKGVTRAKISLLLADKSIAEMKNLLAKGRTTQAIEAGNEAVDKLEYADKLIGELKPENEGIKQLRYQTFWAGYAYREIIERAGGEYDVDTEKFTKLIKRINDWNKKEEEKRYTWAF